MRCNLVRKLLPSTKSRLDVRVTTGKCDIIIDPLLKKKIGDLVTNYSSLVILVVGFYV